MRPVTKNFMRKKNSLIAMMVLRKPDKTFWQRRLSTSAKFSHENTHAIDQQKVDGKQQQSQSVLSFYGSAFASYIQEPLKTSNIGQKFYKEFNSYYNYINTVVTSSKLTKTEKIKPQVDSVNKIEPNPISLKDPNQQKTILIPKKIAVTTQVELSIEEKTAQICEAIEKATSILVKSTLVNDLFKLLYQHPEDVKDVIYRRHKTTIYHLIGLRDKAYAKNDKNLYGNINQCLAIIGYVDPSSVKHRGINILALDGGGAKGFVTIEILKNIEKLSGKPIHETFDYICGTSTGAVLAALVGIYKLSLNEIERQYKFFIKEIFSTNRATGFGNLVMTYAYYDTKVWENMLKEAMGDTLVINSAKDKDACKISLVSNVTTPNHMKVFLFRNYNIPSWTQSHYDGTIRHKVWEALRASSAAPGYYEDFKIDGYVFHDGGLLANNPTPIALHEVKHLWPSSKINCVVSIGNGRYKPAGYMSTKADSISLKQKINRIVGGISCTETVHNMLLDLIPTRMYFRFNPYLSEEFHLDENRPLKWKLMQYETNMYMRRNKYKFEMAANRLVTPKSTPQQLCDLFKERYLSSV